MTYVPEPYEQENDETCGERDFLISTDDSEKDAPGFEPVVKPAKSAHKRKFKAGGDETLWQYVWDEMRTDTSFYLVIFLVAFDEGTMSMSDLALKYLYKDDLRLDPNMMSLIQGLVMAPWIMKPIWGFMSDGWPIFGYTRRSYLCIAGLTGALMWMLMATSDAVLASPYAVAAIMFTVSLSCAFMSTVAKAILVEHCEGQDQSYASFVQTYFHLIYYVISLCFSYLGGYLLEHVSKHVIFAITMFAPTTVFLISPFLREEKPIPKSIKSQFKQLIDTVSTKNNINGAQFPLWRPMLFMLLFASNPTSQSAMFFFFTEKLHFDPEFIASISMVSTACSIIGIVLYQRYLADASYRKVLLFASIMSTVFSSLPVLVVTQTNRKMGIPDGWFIMGDQAMTGALGQIAQFPLLVLGSRICPRGVEGTLYALLMSILNFGSMIGNWLGAILMTLLHVSKDDFTNLHWLIIICCIWSLLPLFLLGWLLPKSDSQTIQNISARDAEGHSQQADEGAPLAAGPEIVCH